MCVRCSLLRGVLALRVGRRESRGKKKKGKQRPHVGKEGHEGVRKKSRQRTEPFAFVHGSRFGRHSRTCGAAVCATWSRETAGKCGTKKRTHASY